MSFAVACPAPPRVRVSRGRGVARRTTGRRLVSAAVAGPDTDPRPAVVVLPGLGNETSDYTAFALELEQRGFSVTVAEVRRPDWLRNAAGLVDVNYWKGTLEPRPTVDWYLGRIGDAIVIAKQKSGSDKVRLVAHSAGGWMARVYLSDFGCAEVCHFVSLGSPLKSVPSDVPGVVDQTRGILSFVEANCDLPVVLNEKGVRVTCLAGKWLEGSAEFEMASPQNFLIGQGYKQVCGYSDVWGDGITPVAAAHLEGADNIILNGAFHTPVGSSDARPWYGTPEILGQWVEVLR